MAMDNGNASAAKTWKASFSHGFISFDFDLEEHENSSLLVYHKNECSSTEFLVFLYNKANGLDCTTIAVCIDFSCPSLFLSINQANISKKHHSAIFLRVNT
jgi:hypothetical protein